MQVLQDYLSPTQAGARLGVCGATVLRRAKAGALPAVVICGRPAFRAVDIEKAAENCRPRTESEQLKKIVETLADPEPTPTFQAPVYDDKGMEVLGRLPKNRLQVFRMGPDGERVLALIHLGPPVTDPSGRERDPVESYVTFLD